jgi:hypothetical protein
MSQPPLHDKAITGEHEIRFHPEANVRFPTAGLEPFQIQRAEALERAAKLLPDNMIEDIIRAAAYIESGRLIDVV